MGTVNVTQTDRCWLISATGGSSTLPIILVPAGNYAFVESAAWVSSGATAGQGVIVKNLPPTGGTAYAIYENYAGGSNYNSYPIAYPGKLGQVTQGLQVTKLDSGDLIIGIK